MPIPLQRVVQKTFLRVGSATISAQGIVGGYTNLPPVWTTIPIISFTQGLGEDKSVDGYESDPNPGETTSVSYIGGTLPNGVSFIPASKVYRYNGIEAPGSTDTSRLRATDNGIPPLSADSNLHRVEIVSNLQWSTTPNPSPVELLQGSYNLGQNIPNYSSATDEFRFTPGYTIPPWLGPLTGTGGVTLPWNGAQTVADSFDNTPGIAVDVRRSGGAWVSSQPFGVTVTQPSSETDYWYPIPELTFIEGVPSRISLLPYRKQTTGILRYTGGYSPESGAGAGYGYWQHIEGIYLDCTTVDMVYDGTAQRPAYPQVSSDYFVGMERAADNVFGAWTTETKLFPVGPSGHRGQFPPTPPASGGGFPGSGGKHLNVRAVGGQHYVLMHDSQIAVYGAVTSQPIWRVQVQSGGEDSWVEEYPHKGRVGEVLPGLTDNGPVAYDSLRNGFWVCPGDRTPYKVPVGDGTYTYDDGTYGRAQFAANGGLGNMRFDTVMFYSLTTHTWTDTGVRPYGFVPMQGSPIHEWAYDYWNDRIVGLIDSRLVWVSCAALMAGSATWQVKDMQVHIGGSDNLTPSIDLDIGGGTGGADLSKLHMDPDSSKRWMYAHNPWTGHFLRVSMEGNPAGTHKMGALAVLPELPGSANGGMAGAVVCENTFVIMPSRRRAILVYEPRFEDFVRRNSQIFDIDLDTGIVKTGPRFPNTNEPWQRTTTPLEISYDSVRDEILALGIYTQAWPQFWSSSPLPQWQLYSIWRVSP